MDWDLWGPTYNQVAVDPSYGTQPGGQFGYYFGYGPDLLEETALNEKYCIQVLTIKNTKADAEIDQLEEDLLVLQSRLVWTEDEKWSEKCFAALREKIDCLNSSILNLKKEEEHDVNAYLKMHREPAEKIHEIIKVLLKNYLEKEEQPLDVLVRESSSETLGHAIGLLDEGKQFNKFDSNIVVKQEIQEPNYVPSEKFTAPNSPLKPGRKKTDSLKEVKPLDVLVKETSSCTLGLATDLLYKRKKFSNFDSNRAVKEEIREPTAALLEKCTSPDSSSNSEGKKTDFPTEVKPANTTIQASSLDTSKPAAVCSDGSRSLCEPVSHGMEKVSELKPTTTDECRSLNSFPKSDGKGTNTPDTNKPVDATVKNFSSDSLRHASGLHSNNGIQNLSDSGSSLKTIVQTKSADSCVKQIKSNSTSENTQNECIKESMGALTDKNDSSNSLLKMDEKTSPLLTRKVQDGVITDTENIAVVSNLDLQVQNEKDTTQKKLEEGRKTRPCEEQKVEIVANDKSNLICLLKSQRLKEPQRKFLPNSLNVQESSVPMEVNSDISSISRVKKQRKSIINDNATLVDIMNESKLKKLVDSDRCAAKVCGVAPDVSKKSVPQSQKKRKKCPDSPIIVGIKYPTFQKDLHRDATDAASEEDSRITNPCSTGISDNEAVPSSPTSRLNYLNKLSMVDLKSIAKQHKLTRYSGLRKFDLIQQIVTRLQ